MTTIGKQWLDRQEAAGVARAVKEARRHEDTDAKKAAAVISQIPKLIAAASDDAESVLVYDWFSGSDVAGNKPDELDKLARRLCLAKHCLRLCADDLSGMALIIFNYCDQNGLECLLKLVSNSMNEEEYHFHVRPKLG